MTTNRSQDKQAEDRRLHAHDRPPEPGPDGRSFVRRAVPAAGIALAIAGLGVCVTPGLADARPQSQTETFDYDAPPA
jgi:hypothetical protein